MVQPNKTAQKLTSSIVIIAFLAVCLCITTFALIYSMVSVDNNLFETGVVKINLNGGKPVIEEHEFLFEPGMSVKKDFFLENQSTCDVYYKLYFDHVEGALASVLEVQIQDRGVVLFTGTLADLTKDKVGAANDILRLNERRSLQILFHFPEQAKNVSQGQYVSFDMSAEAVQTQNNPYKLFN